MEEEKYIKCKYCSGTYKYEDHHVERCKANYDEVRGILCCYSCGEENKNYSQSQLAKKDKARCTECVINHTIQKFAPYLHLYSWAPRGTTEVLPMMSINAQLIHYVSNLNFKKVRTLLAQHANPNYIRQEVFRDDKDGHIYWYKANGTEYSDNDQHQPTTNLPIPQGFRQRP